MKKYLLVTILLVSIISCNNARNENETGDSTGLTNPTAIDTTKHPSGVDNSSVISTDTAAMNVQNSINKAKEAKKKGE